jgi:hypothetical protein
VRDEDDRGVGPVLDALEHVEHLRPGLSRRAVVSSSAISTSARYAMAIAIIAAAASRPRTGRVLAGGIRAAGCPRARAVRCASWSSPRPYVVHRDRFSDLVAAVHGVQRRERLEDHRDPVAAPAAAACRREQVRAVRPRLALMRPSSGAARAAPAK